MFSKMKLTYSVYDYLCYELSNSEITCFPSENVKLIILITHKAEREYSVNFTLCINSGLYNYRKIKRNVIIVYNLTTHKAYINNITLGPLFLFEKLDNIIHTFHYWIKLGEKPSLDAKANVMIMKKIGSYSVDLERLEVVVYHENRTSRLVLPFTKPVYWKLARLTGAKTLSIVHYLGEKLFESIIFEEYTGVPLSFNFYVPTRTSNRSIIFWEIGGKKVQVKELPMNPIAYMLGIREYAGFTLEDIEYEN